MAFKKDLSCSGFTANYLQLTFFRFDRRTREVSAHWDLYKDRNTARDPNESPLHERAVKLRVTGQDFTTFFGGTTGAISQARLYEVAKSVSSSPETYPQSAIWSDYGHDVFASADDVIET